jgi:hypothetical protein
LKEIHLHVSDIYFRCAVSQSECQDFEEVASLTRALAALQPEVWHYLAQQ